jgi:dGTPase
LPGVRWSAFSGRVSEAEQGLKHFMFRNVYRSEVVMNPVRRSEAVVAELFDGYY